MINKIDVGQSASYKGASKVAPDNARLEKVSTEQSKAGASSGKRETVDLASSSINLRKLEAELSQTPAFDSTRVSEIKAAISDGSYKIDLSSISRQIIEIEKLVRDIR